MSYQSLLVRSVDGRGLLRKARVEVVVRSRSISEARDVNTDFYFHEGEVCMLCSLQSMYLMPVANNSLHLVLHAMHQTPSAMQFINASLERQDQRMRQRLFFNFLPPTLLAPPWVAHRAFSSFISISLPTAVLTASSKISCTPSISLLEHSKYMAPICWATVLPCSCVTGVKPCVLSMSIQARLWRRSDLSPTRTRGVVGQKWSTSGYH